MTSKAPTVLAYLNQLPEDRRAIVEAVLEVIRKNKDSSIEEGMQYGMIGYFIPHSVFPDGYHCDPKQPLPFAGLASQKAYISLYLMALYGMPDMLKWFQTEWAKTGKKLNMGKSCIRFATLEDVPLELIGQTFKKITAKKFIDYYQENLIGMKGQKAQPKKEKKPRGRKKKVVT